MSIQREMLISSRSVTSNNSTIMYSKRLYFMCIYLFLNTTSGQDDFFSQQYKKHLLDNVQDIQSLDMSSVSDIPTFNKKFDQLLSPPNLFKNLMTQKGLEDIFQQCIVHSVDPKSRCTQSLCELFLAFIDPKQYRVPQWVLKSK